MSAADTAYPERERIANSFSLASGSRIEISTIAGPVEIDTTSDRRHGALARGLALTVSDLSDRGVHVSSVTGGLDLDVGSRADAAVITRSVAGNIDNDVRCRTRVHFRVRMS